MVPSYNDILLGGGKFHLQCNKTDNVIPSAVILENSEKQENTKTMVGLIDMNTWIDDLPIVTRLTPWTVSLSYYHWYEYGSAISPQYKADPVDSLTELLPLVWIWVGNQSAAQAWPRGQSHWVTTIRMNMGRQSVRKTRLTPWTVSLSYYHSYEYGLIRREVSWSSWVIKTEQ